MQEITMADEPISRYEFILLKDNLEAQLLKIEESLSKLWNKIDGRPSWAVLVIISLLSSLVVGLSVVLVK